MSVQQKTLLMLAKLRYNMRILWCTKIVLPDQINLPAAWFSIWAIVFVMWLAIGLQPAEAKTYEISGHLEIPSIALNTDIASLSLENGELHTPSDLAGSYSNTPNKTFLVGHSTGIFQNLKNLQIGDQISYNGTIYIVSSIKTVAKPDISMNELLAAADRPTLILMTCAGELYENGDASHRLIIEAVSI